MGKNYNAEMFFNKEENNQVFYVRPFSNELKADLDRLIVDVRKVAENVSITEKDGTYCVATNQPHFKDAFMESFWGILFRRFSAEANRVCVDPITEEKYYVLIFSSEFIKPCARRLVA